MYRVLVIKKLLQVEKSEIGTIATGKWPVIFEGRTGSEQHIVFACASS